jgi:hypothetical protein
MEWLLILIPIIIGTLLLWLMPHRFKWQHLLIQIGASIILIFLSKLIVEKVQVSADEVWGGYITTAKYTERWNEYIHQTCTCCCDSKGNNCSTYDCSYVEEHPPLWEVWDCNGQYWSVDEGSFRRLCKMWGNGPTKIGHINGYTKSADVFQSNYNNKFEDMEPTTVTHEYENRVQASTSIYNYPYTDIKKNNLFPHPKEFSVYRENPILGGGSPDEQLAIERLNATVGPNNQCHVYILFFINRPMSDAMLQEAAWKNGNKNELNICIGLDKDSKIIWSYVFSWTEKIEFKNSVRDYILSQGYINIASLNDWLYNNIPGHWERKHFKDFKRLAVQPPLWTIFLDAGLLMILCSIMAFIAYEQNEYETTESRFSF